MLRTFSVKLNRIFSSKQSIFITIITCAGIIAAFYFFVHSFYQQRILRSNLECKKLTQVSTNILNYKNKYGNLDDYINELEERYQLASVSVPNEMQQGEFINFLQQLSVENKIKISSIVPSAIQPVEETSYNDSEGDIKTDNVEHDYKNVSLNKLSINIKFESGYIELINFLKAIEASERLLKIDTLYLIGKGDGNILICDLNITIFSLND